MPGILLTVVDNMNNFFVTGLTSNNNLSLSGGNSDTKFYFSAGYLNAKGIVPLNEWSRASFTLNGEHRFAKWLTAGGKITYTHSGGTRIQQGSNTSGVMLSLARQAANWDNGAGFDKPWLDKRSYQFPDYTQRNQHRGGGYDNPYWSVNNNPFNDKVDRITGNANIIVAPVEWMNLTYRIGTDFYTDRRRQFYEIGSRSIPAGRIIEDNYFVQDLTQDVYLTFNKEIIPGLRGNLIIGNNIYQTNNQNVFERGTTLVIPDYRNISNASTKEAFETLNRRRTAAWYTDLGLSWESMIFLNATYRHEWSTSLPTDFNNFGFPSVSASFVFTELDILKDNKILSFGKVRGSLSKIGNDAPIYGTQATYPSAAFGDGWTTTAISFPAFGTSGFTVTNTLPNGDLKPEKTTEWEARS